MKLADRILQRWRIHQILPYLKAKDRVLDIGSAEGALFARMPGWRQIQSGLIRRSQPEWRRPDIL